jgi:hypothetical protein
MGARESRRTHSPRISTADTAASHGEQRRRSSSDADAAAMERTPAAAASAGGKGAWRDGAVTYLHLLFYIAISGGQIFFNKASHQAKQTPSLSTLSPLASPAAAAAASDSACACA